MKSTATKIAVVAVVLFGLGQNFAQAHPTGQSLIKDVNGYHIDIGYDSITTSPVAGQATAFDYLLFDQNNNPAQYTNATADITLQNGETALFADVRKNPEGPTGMVYIFPKSGSYKFKVTFKNNDEVLAQADFPLTVTTADYELPPDSPKKYWANFASGAIVGILVLGLMAAVFKARKKKRY